PREEAAGAPAVQEAEQPGEEALQAVGPARAAVRAGRPVREVRPPRAVAPIPGQAARVPIPGGIIRKARTIPTIRTTLPTPGKIGHRGLAKACAGVHAICAPLSFWRNRTTKR